MERLITGEIVFCSRKEALKLSLNNFDIKYMITVSIKKGTIVGFTQNKGLAPSIELYNKTFQKWKKFCFTEEERNIMQEGKTHTWFDLYEKVFEDEMNTRIDFQKEYQKLKQELQNNKRIICVCYCEEAMKCHRSLIAKRLEKEGFHTILL